LVEVFLQAVAAVAVFGLQVLATAVAVMVVEL
jgi:hypothetical protein